MKRSHHADLRTALLEAALGELEENGPRDFSLRHVAVKAGVSHSAPYRHFPDKQALLAAMVLKGMRSLTRALRLVPKTPDNGAWERLERLGKAYMVFSRENPQLIALMFSGIGFDAVAQADKGSMDAGEYDAFGELEAAVAACQLEGSLDVTRDSGVLAMLIWSTVHGLSILYNENVIQTMMTQRGVPEDNAESTLLDALDGLFR